MVPDSIDQPEHHFCQRRIDRRDVFVVDADMECIPMLSNFRSFRGIEIRIDPLILHPAIPDIPEDIVRQRRRAEQERQSAQHRHTEYQGGKLATGHVLHPVNQIDADRVNQEGGGKGKPEQEQ